MACRKCLADASPLLTWIAFTYRWKRGFSHRIGANLALWFSILLRVFTNLGGVIAVNYEARAKGVKRGMRRSEAQALCPDLIFYYVPEARQKADLSRYRLAGREVLKVFCSFGATVECASIDEAYIDLTALVNREGNNEQPVSYGALGTAYVEGYDTNRDFLSNIDWKVRGGDAFLARGAEIMTQMRREVFLKTKFTCSAGISHNKVVAKLAAGLHKPNQLTVVPHSSVHKLFETVAVHKMRGLGGKLGEQVSEHLQVQTMAQLAEVSAAKLTSIFGTRTGMWLYELSHGVDHETVADRLLSKSIGCAKNFPGKTALMTVKDVSKWANSLCEEMEERLKLDQKTNQRVARLLTVSNGIQSRSIPLTGITFTKVFLYNSVMAGLSKLNVAPQGSGDWTPPIKMLSFIASKFEVLDKSANIMKYIGNTKKSTERAEAKSSTSSTIKGLYFCNVLSIQVTTHYVFPYIYIHIYINIYICFVFAQLNHIIIN
ncbi:DNA polymerase eta-like isoform X2 [Varroa jacobsoni]|uniref:DNA polymerase eta-like isoform X2 n=1 Tax=Varroa jacobsoni TaxID=62625 RepID=UPI000BF7F022|nr:DNA polymerase eta-like isoform X2 [Varroa jacobsoni]